jgi:5-methylthioribose kinase
MTLAAARSSFLERLFADMLGFAACKMIRRIVGFAHVTDFERIADPSVRAACEAAALTMARTLLTDPAQFHSIQDLIDAVPRAARR